MKKTLLIILLLVFVSTATTVHANLSYISCKTNSMYPTFDCTDSSKLYQVNKDFKFTYDKNIHVGDIIAFRVSLYNRYKARQLGYPIETALVVHRVIEITDKGYITKGDNNANQDWWITPLYMVSGKVEVLK